MPPDADSQETQSVGDRSKVTNPPETLTDILRRPQTLYTALKVTVDANYGIPQTLAPVLISIYVGIGILLGFVVGPLSVLGYLCFTTGLIIGSVTIHENGVITPETRTQTGIYYATTLMLLGIGLRYILFGSLPT